MHRQMQMTHDASALNFFSSLTCIIISILGTVGVIGYFNSWIITYFLGSSQLLYVIVGFTFPDSHIDLFPLIHFGASPSNMDLQSSHKFIYSCMNMLEVLIIMLHNSFSHIYIWQHNSYNMKTPRMNHKIIANQS